MQPLDAERVREWRHRRMLSQQELADRAGTSLFTIQRIERGEGNVRPKTGRGVAAALGVPIEELLPKAQSPLPFEEAARAQAIAQPRNGASAAGRLIFHGNFEDLTDARQVEFLEGVRDGRIRIEGPITVTTVGAG